MSSRVHRIGPVTIFAFLTIGLAFCSVWFGRGGSLKELDPQGTRGLGAGAPSPAPSPARLPIAADGITYNMAQEAAWIDSQHFAVGRWDGSLSIFAFNQSQESGPIITTAISSPSSKGVQMITWVAPGVFATSNDDGSMIVWKSVSGNWRDLKPLNVLKYASTFGIANSGTSFKTGNTLYFVAGHENGHVTIWSGKIDGAGLTFVRDVNLRSSHPLNPFNLYNVRGVAPVFWTSTTGYVVTGSEDGDLCIVEIPSGKILSRTVYNPKAQRGINSIAVFGQNLLVANCAVGADDKNLWYYWIDRNDWSITLRDSTNLKVNPDAPQVYNFDVIWGLYSKGVCFFSSTEEGALWMGTVTSDRKLSVFGYQNVTVPVGSALAFGLNGELLLVSYNLYEFTTGSDKVPVNGSDPGRLPQSQSLQSWPMRN
jgi:WD40 repeat protein